MSTTAMNNLWNYLQGLSLSSRNKRWLAERLIESTAEPKANQRTEEVITEADLMISPEVAALVKGFELPDDFNAEQAKLDYLTTKYK